jgi:hypothetical protein
MTYYPQSTAGLNYKTYPVGPTATSTTVTSNASANTKGSYTEIIASADFTANGVWIEFPAILLANRTFLVDIATGAAASESVVIPNLMVETNNNNSIHGHYAVFFPLAVASGARVAARCQDSTGSGTISVAITLVAAGDVPGCAAFTAYGVNTATSLGTSVDPGGTINTKGAYSEITSSLSAIAQYAVLLFSGGGNTAVQSFQWAVDLATGAAASEVVLVPDLRTSASNSASAIQPKYYGFPIYIAASTRVAVRASCNGNDATDRLIQCALYTSVAPSESSGGGGGSFTFFGA